MLKFALTLDILRHEEMVTIPNDVAKLVDPIAQDDHARLFGELLVYLNMAMTIDKIIYVRVILNIMLRIEHEVLAVLTHIGRFLSVGTLHARMLSPIESEPHAPSRMKGRKQHLTDAVMEDVPDGFEATVRIA